MRARRNIFSLDNSRKFRPPIAARHLLDDVAITIIEEVTHSNIQKALNVQAEIERVRRINSISVISPEIVQAASASLLLDVPNRSQQ